MCDKSVQTLILMTQPWHKYIIIHVSAWVYMLLEIDKERNCRFNIIQIAESGYVQVHFHSHSQISMIDSKFQNYWFNVKLDKHLVEWFTSWILTIE